MKNMNNKFDEIIHNHRIDEILELDFSNIDMKVYIGGGLFNMGDQLINAMVEDICIKIGLYYYNPQNVGFNDKETTSFRINNKIISDGDIDQINSCDVVFARLTSEEDSGLSAEIGYVTGYNKDNCNKKCLVALADDIRLLTVPNEDEVGVDNQVMYLNSFIMGLIQNANGVYYTLYDVFKAIHEFGIRQ